MNKRITTSRISQCIQYISLPGNQYNQSEHQRDSYIDEGAGYGYPELLNRFFADTFQAGNTSNRRKKNVTCLVPILSGNQRMAIFMQDHTNK